MAPLSGREADRSEGEMEPTSLLAYLTTCYAIDRVVTNCQQVLVLGHTTASSACCPRCGSPSHRVHSYYQRQVQELPCLGRSVRLLLRVRRFRCLELRCPQQTFAESLAGLAPRYARRSIGQQQALQEFGLTLGGQAGAKLARRLGYGPVSGQTLLRAVQQVPLPPVPTPRVLGVDDWAWRKGRRYGTILCDGVSGRVIDLLAEHTSEALASWLRQHPGVELITRDRSKICRRAAQQAAPQAIQVADRFHLLKNLQEQVAQALARQPPRALLLETSQPSPPAPVLPPTPIPEPLSQSAKQQRYEQICRLRASGLTIRAIATAVGSTRATVDRWLARGAPSQPRAYPTQRAPPRQRQGQAAAATRLSPKQGAWLLVSEPKALDATRRARLQQLLEQQPELEPLYQLAQRFVQLVKHGQSEQLADWIAQAQQCAWVELRQLAQGLAQDAQAVQAALRLPQSNGVVEGQITRLKLLKRSMYGRASFDLLRRRVLLRR